tara:strand:+ start:1042 stop:1656 length:615 start_codon:yes stop_codon:yes gene_type:complete
MRFKYYYWVFDKGLPESFCDDVIKYCKSLKSKKGLVGTKGKDVRKDVKVRDSNIVFTSERWIYRQIHPFIHSANRNAGWNFHWNFSEPIQFTEYKKGQYYDWHYDMFKDPFNAPDNNNLNKKVRKLSAVISLSDGNKYEGGDLEFYYGDSRFRKNKKSDFEIPKEMRNKGSIIVFPAFVFHRVTPVTKGTRHSLVNWNVGNPYT